MSIQTLKKEITKLNRKEQAEIMHFMVELFTAETFELSDEWKKELTKRETALENGASIGRPASDVLTKYNTTIPGSKNPT